jgi:asparaginyl-tRNA synthetase
MDYKLRTKISKILVEDSVPVDTNVIILGLVRTVRDSKGVAFVEINDGSCFKSIQGVISNPEQHPELADILTGASVRMAGKLILSQGQGQKYDVAVDSLKLIGPADASYPLQKKRHSYEFLRDIAHLRPRTNTFGAINRMRSQLSYAIHTYFQERGFAYVHTPIVSTSDCEGAGDLFRVSCFDFHNVPKKEGKIDWESDFFGAEAYLTVSGQLEGELVSSALGDIYTFGPTFRAENSNTARHASEFWMIEPEMMWAELEDNMDLAEDFLKYLFKFALDKCGDDMDFFAQWVDKEVRGTLERVVTSSFERVPYSEAISLLEKSGQKFDFPVKWGLDMQTEHERFLTEKLFNKPVIVYDYPEEIKSFYMRINEDGKTVRAMDVLVPRVGEIIGGSQREERYDVLVERMKQKGMTNLDAYYWYLDIRRYGSMPHSGFGLGFERAMMYITGMANIRDVLPFPRVPGWAKF